MEGVAFSQNRECRLFQLKATCPFSLLDFHHEYACEDLGHKPCQNSSCAATTDHGKPGGPGLGSGLALVVLQGIRFAEAMVTSISIHEYVYKYND